MRKRQEMDTTVANEDTFRRALELILEVLVLRSMGLSFPWYLRHVDHVLCMCLFFLLLRAFPAYTRYFTNTARRGSTCFET